MMEKYIPGQMTLTLEIQNNSGQYGSAFNEFQDLLRKMGGRTCIIGDVHLIFGSCPD